MRENTSCRVWEISAIGFTELRPEGDFTTETRRTQSSEWILNWPEVMASAVVTPSRTPNSEPRTPNPELRTPNPERDLPHRHNAAEPATKCSCSRSKGIGINGTGFGASPSFDLLR